MKLTVNVQVEITKDIVCEILECAFSGMSYWAEGMYVKDNGDFIEDKNKSYYTSERYAEILWNNGILEVTDLYDANKKYELNLSNLCNGIKIILEKYNHLADINALEEVDSQGAECIIQCALFGDIIYG